MKEYRRKSAVNISFPNLAPFAPLREVSFFSNRKIGFALMGVNRQTYTLPPRQNSKKASLTPMMTPMKISEESSCSEAVVAEFLEAYLMTTKIEVSLGRVKGSRPIQELPHGHGPLRALWVFRCNDCRHPLLSLEL